MSRYAVIAAVAGLTLLSTALHAAKPLPAKTTQQAYAAFVQKAAGAIKKIESVAEYKFGPGFRSEFGFGSVLLSENTNDGQTVDATAAAALKYETSFCKKMSSKTVARQAIDDITLLRFSHECHAWGEDLFQEDILISDGTRYQLWIVSGFTNNRAAIERVAGNIFDGLLAAHR